jgi:hypothetical protein
MLMIIVNIYVTTIGKNNVEIETYKLIRCFLSFCIASSGKENIYQCLNDPSKISKIFEANIQNIGETLNSIKNNRILNEFNFYDHIIGTVRIQVNFINLFMKIVAVSMPFVNHV